MYLSMFTERYDGHVLVDVAGDLATACPSQLVALSTMGQELAELSGPTGELPLAGRPASRPGGWA